MGERYNGWTNRNTWSVKLWMDNDQSAYHAFRELARFAMSGRTKEQAVGVLADMIKEEHETQAPECRGVYGDLMTYALSSVNWREIAQSLIDEIAEEQPDNDKAE